MTAGSIPAPRLGRFRPLLGLPAGAFSAGLCRSPAPPEGRTPALDPQLRQRRLEVHALHLGQVSDGIPTGTTLTARPDPLEPVLGTDFAQVFGPVRPDHETVGLPRFTTAQGAGAVPCAALSLHSLAKAALVVIKQSHLSAPVRLLIPLTTYFIILFSYLDRWTDTGDMLCASVRPCGMRVEMGICPVHLSILVFCQQSKVVTLSHLRTGADRSSLGTVAVQLFSGLVSQVDAQTP